MDEKKLIKEEENLIINVSDDILMLLSNSETAHEIFDKFEYDCEIDGNVMFGVIEVGIDIYNKMIEQNLTKDFVKACTIINEKIVDTDFEETENNEDLICSIQFIQNVCRLFKVIEQATAINN